MRIPSLLALVVSLSLGALAHAGDDQSIDGTGRGGYRGETPPGGRPGGPGPYGYQEGGGFIAGGGGCAPGVRCGPSPGCIVVPYGNMAIVSTEDLGPVARVPNNINAIEAVLSDIRIKVPGSCIFVAWQSFNLVLQPFEQPLLAPPVLNPSFQFAPRPYNFGVRGPAPGPGPYARPPTRAGSLGGYGAPY